MVTKKRNPAGQLKRQLFHISTRSHVFQSFEFRKYLVFRELWNHYTRKLMSGYLVRLHQLIVITGGLFTNNSVRKSRCGITRPKLTKLTVHDLGNFKNLLKANLWSTYLLKMLKSFHGSGCFLQKSWLILLRQRNTDVRIYMTVMFKKRLNQP